MRKIIAGMQKIQILIGGLFLLLFFITVAIQMFTRYVGIIATWTEDVEMYSFIWAVFMGASAMVYEKKHFAFTALNDSLKKVQSTKKLSIVVSVVMMIFCILMAYYGTQLTKQFWNYTWVNIPKFKRGVTWICVPIAGITSTIYLLDSIVSNCISLANSKDGAK
ncbi:TRAP transporter small permease [Treponema parvum]|uniref:TRAP transporter small permease n=1 Tax=Treponema parvum TaxID=138851 RepID=UPI001AEBACB6|nr:TRAP transporter small permease subunit [Treponema parvum]QTQ15584.1 TRAP transporter small permease subunit [Treponema parvum]